MPTNTNTKVIALQKEIELLTNNIESKSRLSSKDKQLMLDEIAAKKREIEKLTKEEKKITPIIASTISERKQPTHEIFLGNNRVLL